MTWEKYEKAAQRGPFALIWAVGKPLFALFIVLSAIAYMGGWIGNAGSVLKKEFSASALLKKYEWFKDAAAQLDKKQADINVYGSRIKAMPVYKEMDRTQREQFMLWQTELAGIKASYNGLAADYNSQMSKFNWRFTNAGDLPKGATKVLPRLFKPYEAN